MEGLILQDRIFLLLAITVGVLLSLILFFAFTTIALRLRNNRIADKWHQLETRWEPLILDVITGDRTLEDTWSYVDKKEEFFFLNYLQRFANRMRGIESDAIIDLAAPYLPKLVERVEAANQDPPRRARAIRTLADLGLKAHSQSVINALDDPSPLVSMTAARALANKDFPEFAPAILQRLHRFENWSTNYLVSLLSAVGPEITPALRSTLYDIKAPFLSRSVAADALRELKDYEAGSIAFDVLKTETNRDLLAAALRLVGDVGNPEHLTVIRRLCKAEDNVVRGLAFRALGKLGTRKDIPLLREAMADEIQWVALHAARGLHQIGGAHMLEDLLNSGHVQSDLARQVLAEGGAS